MDFFQIRDRPPGPGCWFSFSVTAVVLIVLATYAVVDAIAVASIAQDRRPAGDRFWNPALFGIVTLGTQL